MKPFPKANHTLADAMVDVMNHAKTCDACMFWATDGPDMGSAGKDLYDLRCVDGWILIKRMLSIRSQAK